jgi:hypothetical protein
MIAVMVSRDQRAAIVAAPRYFESHPRPESPSDFDGSPMHQHQHGIRWRLSMGFEKGDESLTVGVARWSVVAGMAGASVAPVAAQFLGKPTRPQVEPHKGPARQVVGTFVPNNAIISHKDATELMTRLMKEKGIKCTTSECTLRGFTLCPGERRSSKAATPALTKAARHQCSRPRFVAAITGVMGSLRASLRTYPQVTLCSRCRALSLGPSWRHLPRKAKGRVRPSESKGRWSAGAP